MTLSSPTGHPALPRNSRKCLAPIFIGPGDGPERGSVGESQNPGKNHLPTLQGLRRHARAHSAHPAGKLVGSMNISDIKNHDQDNTIVPSDGLPKDAAPTDNATADPTDQPIEAALPEAPGTPDIIPESSDSQADSQSSDAQATDARVSESTPDSGTP